MSLSISDPNGQLRSPPRNKISIAGVTSPGQFSKKEALRCMFCGGPHCKRCSSTAYLSLQKPAIEKLHSSWITDEILAMQRPSDAMLEEGNVLNNFVKNKITAVFNLTEPGEHPYCGGGLLSSSGFPYSPEKLMAAGIKHFNHSWRDMTTPKMTMIMDIVNIARHEIAKGGKIAVHCHAGFGRTGIAIACILIVKDKLEASQVVRLVRIRRPGSIQTAAQEKFVYRFEQAYKGVMAIFPLMRKAEKLSGGTNSANSTPLSTPRGGGGGKPGGGNLVGGGIIAAAAAEKLRRASIEVASHSTTHHSSSSRPSSKKSGRNLLSAAAGRNAKSDVDLAARGRDDLILHQKTFAQSVRDGYYVLLLDEVSGPTSIYNMKPKIVHLLTTAIIALAKNNTTLACLAITGLSKLVPKKKWDGGAGSLAVAGSGSSSMSDFDGLQRLESWRKPLPDRQLLAHNLSMNTSGSSIAIASRSEDKNNNNNMRAVPTEPIEPEVGREQVGSEVVEDGVSGRMVFDRTMRVESFERLHDSQDDPSLDETSSVFVPTAPTAPTARGAMRVVDVVVVKSDPFPLARKTAAAPAASASVLSLAGSEHSADARTASTNLPAGWSAARETWSLRVNAGRGPAAVKSDSFMVALNSISEGSEEMIMHSIKEELNANKWNQLTSVCEVVAAMIAELSAPVNDKHNDKQKQRKQHPPAAPSSRAAAAAVSGTAVSVPSSAAASSVLATETNRGVGDLLQSSLVGTTFGGSHGAAGQQGASLDGAARSRSQLSTSLTMMAFEDISETGEFSQSSVGDTPDASRKEHPRVTKSSKRNNAEAKSELNKASSVKAVGSAVLGENVVQSIEAGEKEGVEREGKHASDVAGEVQIAIGAGGKVVSGKLFDEPLEKEGDLPRCRSENSSGGGVSAGRECEHEDEEEEDDQEGPSEPINGRARSMSNASERAAAIAAVAGAVAAATAAEAANQTSSNDNDADGDDDGDDISPSLANASEEVLSTGNSLDISAHPSLTDAARSLSRRNSEKERKDAKEKENVVMPFVAHTVVDQPSAAGLEADSSAGGGGSDRLDKGPGAACVPGLPVSKGSATASEDKRRAGKQQLGGGGGGGGEGGSSSRLGKTHYRHHTETEYSKSQKVSANLVAQLLLDWLETRRGPLLDHEVIAVLSELWEHDPTESIRGGVNQQQESGTAAMGGRGGKTEEACDDFQVGDGADVGAVGGAVADSADEEEYSNYLSEKISAALVTHLDRYKLVVLSEIVAMYRAIRTNGKLLARSVAGEDLPASDPVACSPDQQEAGSPSPATTTTTTGTSAAATAAAGGGAAGSGAAGVGDLLPIDFLVGLRLAIALTHARMDHTDITRHRALNLEIMKIFFFKYSPSGVVVINNITFSEENFLAIQSKYAPGLLDGLDVVLRTLSFLVETGWQYSVGRSKQQWGRRAGGGLVSSTVGGSPPAG